MRVFRLRFARCTNSSAKNPAEYERQQQAIREAEAQRLADFRSIDYRGNRNSTVPTNSDGSYIRSPLQKQVWGEQSREFARLRGEIVDPPTPPAVEILDRTTAYRLTLDGFLFWGDNTPCESPLPVGTRVINAPTPPHYHQNEKQIPAGMKFDPINFVLDASPVSNTTAAKILATDNAVRKPKAPRMHTVESQNLRSVSLQSAIA